MGIRNCAEIGENLQRIMQGLMANDNLVKLLYYEDKDPMSHDALTDAQKKELIYNKLIRILPKFTDADNAKSVIVIKVDNGTTLSVNDEFRTIYIDLMVFVPLTQWFIKNTNLRPFAILGEIQKSLNGKTVNGLGKLEGGSFEMTVLTEEMSCYVSHYSILSYD